MTKTSDLPRFPDFERPAWYARASCRGSGYAGFFPGRATPFTALIVEGIREVCAACPVRAHCLEAAVVHREIGIWAGTYEAERDRLRVLTCAACRAELDPVDVWEGRIERCDDCRERVAGRVAERERERRPVGPRLRKALRWLEEAS